MRRIKSGIEVVQLVVTWVLMGVLAIIIAAIITGCASVPTAMDRALFNIRTNETPVVHVYTNTVVVTNVVQEIRPVFIRVTNEVTQTIVVTTNFVIQTNVVLSAKEEVQSVTNVMRTVEVTPKPVVEAVGSAIVGTAASATGWGGVASTAFVGFYALWARARQKKLTQALNGQVDQGDLVNETLVQSIETARALIKTTPQGQELEQRYKEWLIQNQRAAGIIEVVASLARVTDSAAAKDAARLIAPPS